VESNQSTYGVDSPRLLVLVSSVMDGYLINADGSEPLESHPSNPSKHHLVKNGQWIPAVSIKPSSAPVLARVPSLALQQTSIALKLAHSMAASESRLGSVPRHSQARLSPSPWHRHSICLVSFCPPSAHSVVPRQQGHASTTAQASPPLINMRLPYWPAACVCLVASRNSVRVGTGLIATRLSRTAARSCIWQRGTG
jgi:hypothetical protein